MTVACPYCDSLLDCPDSLSVHEPIACECGAYALLCEEETANAIESGVMSIFDCREPEEFVDIRHSGIAITSEDGSRSALYWAKQTSM